MNVQMAAIVAGAAFLLSFLSGLIGGVPLFDVFVRALLWSALGFGGSLGIETLLRSLVPDLFQPVDEPAAPEERLQGQSVNIALDDEVPLAGGSFVEEVDQDVEAIRAPATARVLEPQGEEPAGLAPVAGAHPTPVSSEGEEEEMPEIGSFLDAFKPESGEGNEAGEAPAPSAPEYADYAPESDRKAASKDVTIDGEVQDPALLARAVQTVLKRDAQGN